MNLINDKKRKFRWTADKIRLLKKYKKEGEFTREIASLMDTTENSINNACYKFNIYLDEEIRNKLRSEAAAKGRKNRIKRYNLTETTAPLLHQIRKLKNRNLTNIEIAKELSIKYSTVCNICTIHKILLDEDVRKSRLKEVGIKGGEIFKKNRQNLAKIHSFEENLGYIVGVCFGDGSAVILKNTRWGKGYLELRTVNKSFAMAFYDALLTYTTQKPRYYIYKHDKIFKRENRIYKNVTYHEIFFNNVFFVENLLRIFGSTKTWKIDVGKFLSYGNKFCKGFLRGMFDSDGSFWITKGKNTQSGNLNFSSTNQQGVLTFYELLIKLGYNFNFNFHRRKNKVIEYSIRSCKLSLVKKYYDNIGFAIDYKQDRLTNFINSRDF